MTTNIFDFSASNVLIVGQTMLDIYWQGSVDRISPESPVPVVKYNDSEFRLAGSGLVAANINSLSGNNPAKCTLITAVDSEDSNIYTRQLVELLPANANNYVLPILDKTAHRIRVTSQGKQLLRVDQVNNAIKSKDNLAELNNLVEQQLKEADINTVIFYDDGSNIINNQYLKHWLDFCMQHKITSIYMPCSNDILEKFVTNMYKADYIILACGYSHQADQQKTMASCHKGLVSINKKTGVNYYSYDGHNILSTKHKQKVENTTGVDEVVAAICGAIISLNHKEQQQLTQQILNLANAAFDYTERYFGQITLNIVELQLACADYIFDNKYNFTQLKQSVSRARRQGQKIVFANGCFDVLHAAHIAYLESAKKRGDKLFVCINSDCSIKRLKGESRPINKLPDRLELLSELDCVDWVVPFYTDTPEDFLRWLQPEILVKGNDYTVEQVVGKEIVFAYGGKVEIIDLPFRKSSTEIIENNYLELTEE